MKKTTIFGTPIAPRHLINELAGSSFCVSYATRVDLGCQLDDVIDAVGEDQILLIDNGAFSAWRAGVETDDQYWEGFENWALDILDRCPQAVAVIPDTIDGGTEENIRLYHESALLGHDRAMVVWHMHEPLHLLAHYASSAAFIAIGSSGKYAKPGTKEWHRRVKAAFKTLDAAERLGYARPHVHMMRAQQFAAAYPFDSTDSTNLAVNHGRYRHEGDGHLARFADRIKGKSGNDEIQRVDTPGEITELAADFQSLLVAYALADSAEYNDALFGELDVRAAA